ncbi:MAG: HK97-gp10 family putative phage morphogenesis protein [Deltaproteobacteria bacterium]
MRIKTEIEGLREAMQKCQHVADEVKKSLGPAVKEGADLIRDDAKSRIHNISGQLSSGVVSQILWDKNASKAFAGAGMDKSMNDKFAVTTKTGVRYYIPSAVEYGHRAPGAAMSIEYTKKGRRKKSKKQIKAHPFMRPAYKNNKKQVALIIENRIRRALKGAVR